MEVKKYELSLAFDGLVGEGVFFYNELLRDRPSKQREILVNQFNDLYHLFLNKFARLTYDPTLSVEQEEEIRTLLSDLLAVRRAIEKFES